MRKYRGRGRKVHSDSAAGIAWIKGGAPSAQSRHVNLRIAALKGRVEAGGISPEFIKGVENHADTLTKNLPPALFRRHTCALLGHRLVQGLKLPGIIELDQQDEDQEHDTLEIEELEIGLWLHTDVHEVIDNGAEDMNVQGGCI